MGDTLYDTLLFSGAGWDYDTLNRTYEAIERIALDELGLDPYPNQIEVITVEQMLDAYASIGLPLMYSHWSFGKHFAREEALYRRGLRGLAYEIVINSSPCISYIMEENSMPMQALVMAHAAFGHNHFFKHNALFREWADAEGILGYMEFAKTYIAKCEERYGAKRVERILDAAHALMTHGVHRYPRQRRLSLKEERQREEERLAYLEQTYDDLWRTVPKKKRRRTRIDEEEAERKSKLSLPEENVLYFLEKHGPRLEDWQREILRIVRVIAQYFYPQKQTKVTNEGCACAVHYHVMNRLYDSGRIDDSAMMEFLHSHTNVVFQPDFDDPRFSGINPYALGFQMMQDIQRVCTDPTEEDRRWLPDIAGNGDPLGTLRHAWANYRDESFILQFLSPHLMRKMKLFSLLDDVEEDDYIVEAIHNESGYHAVRRALATQYNVALAEPDVQVIDADLAGDRKLVLHHRVTEGVLLDDKDAKAVLQHIANLWGYTVKLVEVDSVSDVELREHPEVEPDGLIT